MPASRRRPLPRDALPPPPWTFEVPPAPRVEFRAETPVVVDPLPESGNRLPVMPDIYQDADEDLRPLTSGSWADTVEREERAAAAASTVTLPVVTVVPTALATSSLTTTVNVATTRTVTTATSTPIMTIATTTASNLESVVGDPPIVVTATAATSLVTTPASDTPIPTMVADIVVDSPTTTLLTLASASGASHSGPSASTAAPQADNRPILRFANIAYTVRLTPAGQPDRVVDCLLTGFRTARTREQLLFAVRGMYALLRDVGMFLRECVVLTHVSGEPAQQALDDITSFLDGYMGDDVHHGSA